jgi:single-stranded DNA-specific DHH superfamily exonuclease
MITLGKLKAVRKIVVHSFCPDGLGSAILLYDAFHALGGNVPEVMFTTYNTNEYESLKAEPGLLFCDISPPRSRVQEFVDCGAIVLDHHKTAKPAVEAFGDHGVFGDEVNDPGVCGAVLAYREVWVPILTSLQGDHFIESSADAERAKRFSYLAGVRDTWQTSSPDWETACAMAEALRFYDPRSWLFGNIFSSEHIEWWRTRQELGEILWAKHNDKIRSNVHKAYRFTVGVTRVVIFPGGSSVTSDTAEEIDEDADLVVGFVFHGLESGQASLGFSIRSHTTFDCATFCKALGGGGHTKAAGFSIKFDPLVGIKDPYSTFQQLVERHDR